MQVVIVVCGDGVHDGDLQFMVCITEYGIPDEAGVVVRLGSSYVAGTDENEGFVVVSGFR